MLDARHPTRRTLLAGAGSALGLLAAPAILRAQPAGAPVKLGTLTPLTGSGGSYGPTMRDIVKAVVDEANGAGGVAGRPIQLVSEDDQTSPEAGVRAARKLIDVDGVSAILGTWASAVTTAVAPLCWQNKVALFTVSGSDAITKLPHGGYVFKTQPGSLQQFDAAAEFIRERGLKRIAYLGPQFPFTPIWTGGLERLSREAGIAQSAIIYEADKTSLRSEVEQAMRTNPDLIFLGGYAADTAVLLRDVYRAGFKGTILGPAYAVGPQLIANLPAEATNGIVVWEPWGAVDSGAYKRVQDIVRREVDPYTAQCYDHAMLAILALAASGGAASGEAIRDSVRKVSQGGGERVEWVAEGLRFLREGKKIDVAGASGPLEFTDIGDVGRTQFRFSRVQDKKLEMLKIG